MGVTLSTCARDTSCNSIVDLFDVGSEVGQIEIYTDGFAILLAVLDFQATAFGSSTTGTASANTIDAETSAVNTGEAGAFQIINGDNQPILSGTVSGSGGDINLNTTSIYMGDSLSMSSLTVTVPAS